MIKLSNVRTSNKLTGVHLIAAELDLVVCKTATFIVADRVNQLTVVQIGGRSGRWIADRCRVAGLG